MSISAHSILRVGLLFPLTIGAVHPLNAEHQGGKPWDTVSVVLYEGPLSHDQDWVIKAGPPGPENQEFRGTCSLIPSNVANTRGLERVTFEAEKDAFGIWKMEWKDTVTGTASDGNLYTYQQDHQFTGITTDGHPPRPNRGTPAPDTDDTGFLSSVPNNVLVDALELRDFFLLRTHAGEVVASSHVYSVFRLPLPTDPPPTFLFQHRFIQPSHEQLAGQLGCDPL